HRRRSPRGRACLSRASASRFNCCSPGVTSDSILRSKKERERVSDSPAMISARRLCPQCGAEIPSDAPEGGCPCCLLHVGLLPDAQGAAPDASTITAPDLQLEIAHILLIDVVGYSKLLVNEQIELLEELR